MNKFFAIPVLVGATVLLAGCAGNIVDEASAEAVTLASCLQEEGVVMYGTTWCVHCQNQKAMFGSAFDNVTFIDCDRDRAACAAANITGYPTWIDAEGNSYAGTQSFEQLAAISQCNLTAAPVVNEQEDVADDANDQEEAPEEIEEETQEDEEDNDNDQDDMEDNNDEDNSEDVDQVEGDLDTNS